MQSAPPHGKLDNPLRPAREAAGFTIGQVAKEAKLELKDVYNAERSLTPVQSIIDKILEAIIRLQGNSYVAGSGVSYPHPTTCKAAVAPVVAPCYPVVEDDDDAFDDDEDYEDDDEDDDEDALDYY